MQLPRRLQPDVTTRLPPDTVHNIDRRVGSRLLELAEDGDNVGRVTDGREGLADELGGLVLEHALGRGGDVEKGAFEGEDVNKVVALSIRIRVSILLLDAGSSQLTCSNSSLLNPFLLASVNSPPTPFSEMVSMISETVLSTSMGAEGVATAL